ncbi:MAG: hypothetical protein GY851_05730 [bacterium]|nr:hypothetical protein [bacterium]
MRQIHTNSIRLGALGLVLLLCAGCPPRVPMLRLIFNQGTYGHSGGYSEDEYSTFFGDTQQLGDDFHLTADNSTITYVRWWGAYRDDTPATDDFSIRIYLDNGSGMPESWSYCDYRAGAVAREDTGDIFEPGGWNLNIYEYSTAIPPFVLDPVSTYYIVIVNRTGKWLWSTNGSPSQGNNFGVSRDTTTGPWGSHGLDNAFQLWSNE